VLTDWPTGDLDGSVLFDLSLQYGMIQEVPGGYNSDHHIDADCICPEEGDPWYEYTFRGKAGPGLYSITDMTRRIKELTKERDEWQSLAEAAIKDDAAKNVYYAEMNAKLVKAVEALEFYATQDVTYPNVGTVTFHGHDDEGRKARAALAELKGRNDG
jgi:hypothetical protein